MTQFLNLFNPRELAIAFWILFAFLFCLERKQIRPSLYRCIKSVLKEKIVAWLLLMVAYVFLITLGLQELSFWDASLLKNTVFWLVFSGVYLSFQMAQDREGSKSFKAIVLENVGVLLLVEYLTSLYTFSFFVELLIIPVMSIVILLKLVAERDEKHLIVAKIMYWFEVGFGSMIIALTFVEFINDTKPVAQILSMRSFLLPVVMTMLFIPFLYAQKVYVLYENIFMRISLGRDKDYYFKSTAKIMLFRGLGVSIDKLKRFQKNTAWRLIHAESLEEIHRMVCEFEALSIDDPEMS